jgi:hypothetical protein
VIRPGSDAGIAAELASAILEAARRWRVVSPRAALELAQPLLAMAAGAGIAVAHPAAAGGALVGPPRSQRALGDLAILVGLPPPGVARLAGTRIPAVVAREPPPLLGQLGISWPPARLGLVRRCRTAMSRQVVVGHGVLL